MGGKLIVFEGVEGCGKTSQIQLCSEWLESLGVSVVVTREPGGTELGLHLRRLLLEKAEDKPFSTRGCANGSAQGEPVAELTELLLYAADRSQHVEQELKPNLAAGKHILCDRYTDSTIAYQGYGRGLNMNLINQLNNIATSGLESDLTIWLDVNVEVGLARKLLVQVGLDRIEQETIAFHRRVQQGYAHLAASHSSRIVRVDGSLSKETVQQVIQGILRVHLHLAT
ncbi:MAG: dTMP kinase [Nostoc sp.]|uniref:dTMP kinase n=1 Tax=Nostoc sp. TaxID=1180 RepID=UPI002FF94631